MKGHEFIYTQRQERPPVVRQFRFSHHAYIDTAEGVVRWSSNDRIPPEDTLRDMVEQLLITWDVEHASNWKRGFEEQETLTEYRAFRKAHGYTPEELSEMVTAFGPDAKVVDVLTGKTIR